MFKLEFRKGAENRLRRFARRNPQTAGDISKKIKWLVENVEEIQHERLRGRSENSLHSGQYRILYSLDRIKRVIIVEDIDKHDAAYRRLRAR